MSREPVTVETRHNKAACEVRDGSNGPMIVGYGAVFNRDSENMGFIEQVDPAAFNKTIKEADVRGLANHEPDWLLGRSKSGTLRLAIDEIGLRYEIDVNTADPDGQRALAKVQRGDWDGSSFTFQTIRDEWNWRADPPQRRLLEVVLVDVGPVTFPAYPDATAAARALERVAAKTGHPVDKLVNALRSGEIRSMIDTTNREEPAVTTRVSTLISRPVFSREQLAEAETRDLEDGGDPENMVAMAGAVVATYFERLAELGMAPSDDGISLCSVADADGDADGDGVTTWNVYDEYGVWFFTADGDQVTFGGWNSWELYSWGPRSAPPVTDAPLMLLAEATVEQRDREMRLAAIL